MPNTPPLETRFIPEGYRPPERVGVQVAAMIKAKLADLRTAFKKAALQTVLTEAVEYAMKPYRHEMGEDGALIYLRSALLDPKHAHHDAALHAIYEEGRTRFPEESHAAERGRFYSEQLVALIADDLRIAPYLDWLDTEAQLTTIRQVTDRLRIRLGAYISAGSTAVPKLTDDGTEGNDRPVRSRLRRAAEAGQLPQPRTGGAAMGRKPEERRYPVDHDED